MINAQRSSAEDNDLFQRIIFVLELRDTPAALPFVGLFRRKLPQGRFKQGAAGGRDVRYKTFLVHGEYMDNEATHRCSIAFFCSAAELSASHLSSSDCSQTYELR